MSITIFDSSTRKTINWASGTSTEIFIYPPDGDFATRNFIFRISTATVEAEESTFTFFEGITRHLMILQGELELIHEGRYTKHLKPYDQDTFSGEWQTRSKGKVTDFNLMLKGGATGSLKHYRIEKSSHSAFEVKSEYDFIYVVSGTGIINNEIRVQPGDMIRLERNQTAIFTAENSGNIIQIEVNSNA